MSQEIDQKIRSKSLHKSESLKRLSLILRQGSLIEPVVLNPFAIHIHLPWYEWVKVTVMSVTIAPIRLMMIAVSFTMASLLAYVGSLGDTEETYRETLPYWRKTLRFMSRKALRTMFVFFGFHYIETRGKRAHPSETMILVVAPHSSYCDIIVSIMGRTLSGISKIENSLVFGLKSLGQIMQPIFVNRDDANSRKRTVDLLTERTKFAGVLPQIAVFPEGTTTNRTCLITFKAGSFVPAAPVQPVLMRYPNRIDCMTWVVEQPHPLLMFWLTLCQFNNRCIIEYLPVYYPSTAEKDDAMLFANNVRKVMANVLDIPLTDHSFEDCRLMYLAKKYQLPQASGIVEFSKMSKKLMINFKNMSEFIEYFAEISRELKGKITIESFAEYLGLPISPEVETLFKMYDRSHTGYIDFREYVIGMCLVTMPANTEESLRLAFEMLDPKKKGEVTIEEFTEVLSVAFNMEQTACRRLFNEMDCSKTGSLNYEDFIKFAKFKPEFIKVVSLYHDFQRDAEKDPENERKEKYL